MARSFASASTQYLSHAGTVATADPITIACWGYPLQTNAGCVMVSLANGGSADGRYFIAFGSGGTVTANKENDSGTGAGATGPAYSANAWNHVVGVFSIASSRTAYLNGVPGSADLTSIANPTITNASVGAYLPSGGASLPMNGYLAHAAVWNVALTGTQIASLYNNGIGADPRSVRPDALVAYWPLLNNDGDQDYWGNFHLTASGSPTYAQHPPVLMRSRPKYVVIGSAAPTVGPVTVTGTRTIGQTVTANATPSPGDATLSYQWEKSSTGVGAGTDISGETASTLALTYADFGDILDTAAYVRVGVVATKNAVPSTEEFSPWYEVSAGGAATVGSPFVSSSIR